MRGANFLEADLSGAIIAGAQVRGARFLAAKLSEAQKKYIEENGGEF